MAIISILPNGSTSGNPNPNGNSQPSKRDKSQGWNYQVSRRFKRWLFSIPVDSLDGYGLAFTLTVRDCPKTPEYWAGLRDTFMKRVFRMDCIRFQWLTEWQERGVPHLHGIAYFKGFNPPSSLIFHWLEAASKYGAKPQAQNVKPVFSVKGWLDYLAKHSTRSVTHYQRSSDNIPSSWLTTGRMWGYRGDWDSREAMSFEIEQSGFYAYRRILRNYRISSVRERLNEAFQRSQALSHTLNDIVQSRPEGELLSASEINDFSKLKALDSLIKNTSRELSYARRTLKSNDVDLSHFRGTSSWVDQDLSIQMISWLVSSGYRIHQK